MGGSDSDELPSEEELEEEEGSEEGSDEEDDSEEGSEEEDEDSDADSDRPRRPRKRQKAELPPPGREMPQRATRGRRMGALVKDAEEEQADDQFWNQEFFAEEAQDEVYETESEPEDVADADFSDEDNEMEDDEGEEAEEEARAREPKKKTLKPPGYKKPPLPPKAKPPGGANKAAAAAEAKKKKQQQRASSTDLESLVVRRTVRESTRQKVAEAEEERKLQEMLKPRRVVRQARVVQLTQADLLAEAAKTEIENTRSLQLLQQVEEETKKKAEFKKKKYAGPMIRYLSRAVDGQERFTLEVRNMQTPPELQPREAPSPPPRPVCAVTGQPARYRDPRTGLPYASLEAYRVLQQRALLQQQQQPASAHFGALPGVPPALAPAGLAAAGYGQAQPWGPPPVVQQQQQQRFAQQQWQPAAAAAPAQQHWPGMGAQGLDTIV